MIRTIKTYCINHENNCHYPFLSFNKINPKEVLIQCNECNLSKNLTIHNYIKQMKDLKTNQDNKECIQHHEKFIKFCVNCSKHLCEKCNQKLHKTHQTENLEEKLKTGILSHKILVGCKHISYSYDLKTAKIKHHLLKINEIEYAYNRFESTFNDILKLMESMIETYDENNNNYYLKRNIISMNNINIYNCPKTDTDKDIINYFINYSFLLSSEGLSLKIKKTINQQLSVRFLLLLKDGRLASCSEDATINIYDIANDYNCDIALEGHYDSVMYLCQLNNGKLISCSVDRAIMIWTLYPTSYKIDYTILDTHKGPVSKVISLSKKRIASCSYKTIKIWKGGYPYNHIKTLNGHTNFVYSIIQMKDKLISGSKDNLLCIWDLTTYELEYVIDNVGCFSRNSLLELDSDRILVGGYNVILIANIKDKYVEQKLENVSLNYVNTFMPLKNGNILCGNEKGFMCEYNIVSNILIFLEMKPHESSIYYLIKLNDYQFMSCSQDKTIKIWDY